jgi:hypothetical protein
MGHAPPNISWIDSKLRLQAVRHLIVETWRKQAKIAGNDVELYRAIVYRYDAVIDPVMNACRLPGIVAHQPFGLVWRNVYLDHRSPELSA